MKKYKIKQEHEYDLVRVSTRLVMRRAWFMARKGAEVFGGKVSEYISESLRIVWKNEKKNVAERNAEILAARVAYAEKMRAEREHRENLEYAAENNKNAPRRELVPADKYSEGQKLHGFIITGIGRSFRPHTDMFSVGITPDTEYVEYVYFN